jgi:hypothetical protein
MKCHSNLAQIVLARRPPRCFARGLHRWQKKCHEHANDRNDD